MSWCFYCKKCPKLVMRQPRQQGIHRLLLLPSMRSLNRRHRDWSLTAINNSIVIKYPVHTYLYNVMIKVQLLRCHKKGRCSDREPVFDEIARRPLPWCVCSECSVRTQLRRTSTITLYDPVDRACHLPGIRDLV